MGGTGNLDEDRDGMISQAEFESLLLKPEAARIIQSVGVDVEELVDNADFIFNDARSTLNFHDFMDIILQLRGSNKATVKDLVSLRRVVLTEMECTEERIIRVIKRSMACSHSEPDLSVAVTC